MYVSHNNKKKPGMDSIRLLTNRWRLVMLLALMAWPLNWMTSGLFAQTTSDDQIKAAYLFNFAKLVEWPATAHSANDSPLTFCLLGRSRIGDELESSVGDNKIAGRPLRIRHLQNVDDVAGCHLLFIAGSAGRQQEKAIMQSRGKPILLVGETPGFTNLGGDIGFVQEGGRIGFEVNLAASEQSNLRISARLLSIARSVSHKAN
jgi:YfiR/HmsC-like